MRNKARQTNSTYETKDAQTMKNYNRGTALKRSVGKLLVLGVWLKPVFLTRNLTNNSDTASSYKYLFGPQFGVCTSSVKRKVCISTLKGKNLWSRYVLRRNGIGKQENKQEIAIVVSPSLLKMEDKLHIVYVHIKKCRTHFEETLWLMTAHP